MFKLNSFSIDQDSDRVSRFRELSLKMSQLGDSIGVKIVPFRDESLPTFSRMSSDHQEYVLQDLEGYLGICQRTLAEGASLRDTPRLLWNALRQFKLRPTSDLFHFVPEGNVVEIHNTQHVQIFRNFRFYDCCSYSLEELYCFPWTHLYSRDNKVEQYLLEVTDGIFKKKHQGVVKLDLEPHVIHELYSPFKIQIKAHMKYLAPLFDEDTGKVAAHILVEDGTILNPITREQEAALLRDYIEKVPDPEIGA